jgi:hypothetical protein
MTSSREQWKRWHPIARGIAELLIARADPDLTDEELADVREQIAKLFDKKELERAVRDVLYLAAALEHEGATTVALRLFQVVETKPVIGALDRLSHARAVDRMEAVGQSAKRFAAFSRAAAPRPNSQQKKKGRLTTRDLRPLPILV